MKEHGCEVNFRIQRIRIFGSKGAQLNRQGLTRQFLALSPVAFVREEGCKVGHGESGVLMFEPSTRCSIAKSSRSTCSASAKRPCTWVAV
jgi:hypothetical protein